MTDLIRTVRRVTVVDGVDVTDSFPATSISEILGARLIVVSVGQNSVTYDVTVLYFDAGIIITPSFEIFSNQVTVGEDILDQSLGSFGGLTVNAKIDTHTRIVAKEKVVTNLLIFKAE